MHRGRRIPRRLGFVAALAGLSVALLPGGAVLAAHAAGPAITASPGHWAEVTTPLAGTPIIADIGLARGTDGVLHVLWISHANGHYRVMDTPITSSGVVKAPIAVVKGWFLANDPDAAMTPSGIDVVWSGFSDSVGTVQGMVMASRPRSGGHWSAPVPMAHLGSVPFSTAAATAASDGKLWVASYGTDSLIVDHVGHLPTELDKSNKCCYYNAALATDGVGHTTWVGYLSLVSGSQGIFVRPLRAGGGPAGPARLLPGSREKGSTIPTAERVALTGRPGRAGVFAAYGVGYPVFNKLAIIRIGARTPTALATFSVNGEHLAEVAVAADHSGRLWVAWIDGFGTKPALFVRRSNASGGGFGPVKRIPLPASTTTTWKLYVNAQAGRLDVLVLLTRHNRDQGAAYWATQVLPPKR